MVGKTLRVAFNQLLLDKMETMDKYDRVFVHVTYETPSGPFNTTTWMTKERLQMAQLADNVIAIEWKSEIPLMDALNIDQSELDALKNKSVFGTDTLASKIANVALWVLIMMAGILIGMNYAEKKWAKPTNEHWLTTNWMRVPTEHEGFCKETGKWYQWAIGEGRWRSWSYEDGPPPPAITIIRQEDLKTLKP